MANAHCSYTYNFKDLSTATYQPGGNAIISLDSMSHRVLPNSIYDPEGLGRWTSTLYNGKNGLHLRVIQIYCPPLPSSLSPNSSYSQQHRFFLSHNNEECPRTLFFHHLSQFLTSCMQSHELIILMGDFNHIVDSPTVVNFLAQHSLHNIHQTAHSSYTT